jgi:4-cresol dehydrogenase (hydroxylating)
MHKPRPEKAVAAWEAVVGAEHLYTGERLAPLLDSVCGLTREVPCLLRPGSTAEVQQIVEIANRFKVPVYPVSCGRNWGMGSRLPIRDGCAIIDLCRMNRILEVNPQHHYAVIEPGVTQRQLYEYIQQHRLPLMINVTGSTADTSLIGNSMDRGVGYFYSRAENLSNLEVVLGNGKILRTGFGHFEQAQTANIYRYGVGPWLDGLFAQGNFGIVTRATFDLMPARPAHLAAIMKIDNPAKLPEFIDRLARLKHDGVIETVVHVGNQTRSEITLAPLVYDQLIARGGKPGPELKARAKALLAKEGFGPWSAIAGVLGTPARLKSARKDIRKALKGVAQTVFLNDFLVQTADRISAPLRSIPFVRNKRVLLHAIQPLYEITKGVPTDAPVKSTYWPVGDDYALNELNPDRSRSGLLYCLPILPIDGTTVAQVMKETEEHFRRHGFDAAITVNLMDSKAMECVVSLCFARDDAEQKAAAHRCIQEMEKHYVQAGWPPYRLGIDSMHQVLTRDNFWDTPADLKQVLDPEKIMAPGNYSLT